ncbi:hypothetical protein RUR49_06785 [Pseudoxanthobacter sp. M-2]|uniref:hypothetical protein n=1 Tax=Pseudoxanthobacter sp. M-2 TaxID=3078754 RepID=UPI0038FC4E02
MPTAIETTTTSRRTFLVGMAAAAAPLAALPALAAPGDDAELLRLHAELRPLALAYGKAADNWHRAEHAFVEWLAEQGCSVSKVANVNKLFELRRLCGVEQLGEANNRAGEAVDVVTTAMGAIAATTAAGLAAKLDAMLIEIGTEPRLVFVDPEDEWCRERIGAFHANVAALVGEGGA